MQCLCLANERIDCDKLCMDFENRECVNAYSKWYNPTQINAEKKAAPRKWWWSKSPALRKK